MAHLRRALFESNHLDTFCHKPLVRQMAKLSAADYRRLDAVAMAALVRDRQIERLGGVNAVGLVERYELGNTISSKVLAFAFSLSAEIERSMISSRTKEALARKKSEGQRLGRPKGSYATTTKLTGQEQVIRELLDKQVSYSAIARILGVNRGTLTAFVKRHGLSPRPEG